MTLMTTSEQGLALIRKYEELRVKAYKCPAGVWTVGYGHTRGVTAGMTITPQIAEQLLIEDVRPIEHTLNNLGMNLRQGQFDALVSFCFNVGTGAFNSSTLKKRILAKAADADIAAEFRRWNKATVNGKKVVLPGLTARREAEIKLFLQ